ncbi:hypothetical protein OSH39_01160 [Mycobacterium ulcerans]|uniref:Conserved membrane protein n=3 Tax=Mycobacterium ulcerans TaxID=1809 RepID=A0PVG2_MYCUA|nr:hypothetical protein [Mycobacterium ulcerans]EUA86661.1 putative conserved membrane protein [Mycobacterium ulcerans str. Harvey]ABL06331.1 conserved membrane protein [Mycobacterium ulcerans Agy99]MEB3903389.1 hypothetical protein [Mycobacterium ulcerans]MEB3907523.1 hypothetical protein [Mycobacterium ulcerans]MEB3917580.1 hypothetical protein [Mycobacterium ulcerans]
MGRKVAMLWHASFSIGAGVLYFFFVVPRWPELMGDTAHSLGTGLRITAGALFGLAALPVVFTLLRTRKPELGTPALALSIRTWSIVAHVLAGVLIIGTAISEIWLSLDSVGQWLFGIYGAAAAIAVLGFFAFYLSFVAELPPPPPKPIKVKEPKQRRRRKKGGEGDDVDETDETEDAEDAEDVDEADEADEAEETDEAEEADEASDGEESVESEEAEPTEEAEVAEAAEETAEPEAQGQDATAHGGLRNRRPTGKTSHRRRRVRRGVTVEE